MHFGYLCLKSQHLHVLYICVCVCVCVVCVPLLVICTNNQFCFVLSDGTSCVWDVNSNALLLKYMGHSGSGTSHDSHVIDVFIVLCLFPLVNSIAFHPTERLACTGECGLSVGVV